MTCKDIFDEINEKYIKKDNFKYLVNKYIVSNPIISIFFFFNVFLIFFFLSLINSDMEISIHEDTAICTACFFLVWFQMVYLYRKDHHKEMPDEVKKRGSCWFFFGLLKFGLIFFRYGINCSTMKHNADHAKKLNHICDQVLFFHFFRFQYHFLCRRSFKTKEKELIIISGNNFEKMTLKLRTFNLI